MSTQQNHALRADNQINSPYIRAAHRTFGGVLGDKENAGSEARAAVAAAAATGKLAQEIARHLQGAPPPPGACGKQHQHQHQHGLSSGLSPSMRSLSFATTAADSANSPKAVIGAGGPVLPLSPSSTAARFSNTNFDRYGGGGGREGVSPYSRSVRRAGFAQAHTPAPSPSAAALRLPASRPKKPAASKREVQELRGGGVKVDEMWPSQTSEMKTPEKAALSDAAAKSEATPVVPGVMPKRSRSPVAELTLPPPARCDDEVSRELEAKARRRSAAHSHRSTATRAAASGVGIFSTTSAGAIVFDSSSSSSSCDGRWRKLHARGGGVDGPPRLKLSVETAGDNDEVLLSPSGHQGNDHDRNRDPPARYCCSSPVSLSSSGLESGGRRARDKDNVLASSVDSEWSMGSIDETAARELDHTREEDKISGSDPVAWMLLCQSDDGGINNTAAAATTTTEGGGRGKDDDAVASAAGDHGSPLTPAVGVADVDVDASSPHPFGVAGGGWAAASVFRPTAAKGGSLDAPLTAGLFSLGSRGAGFLDASAVPRTRLFKPVALRLP